MTVKPGTHIRSLRMPPELAEAISEASRKLRMPENRFICQAAREVLRQAGFTVRPPAEPVPDDMAEVELDAVAAGVPDDPWS